MFYGGVLITSLVIFHILQNSVVHIFDTHCATNQYEIA